jgi:hypothetical protein
LDYERFEQLPEPAQEAILQRVIAGKIELEGVVLHRDTTATATEIFYATPGTVDFFIIDGTPTSAAITIWGFEAGDKLILTDSENMTFYQRPQDGSGNFTVVTHGNPPIGGGTITIAGYVPEGDIWFA